MYFFHIFFYVTYRVNSAYESNRKKQPFVTRTWDYKEYQECEGGTEKSVPKITDWHHEACRVRTTGDREERIFLSYPHTNNGFCFLLTTRYLILYWKDMKKTSRKSWIRWDATWWHNFKITMASRIDMQPTCGRRAAVHFLSFPRAGAGMWDRNISNR